jgi:acetolactate synthase-1/2/3 large subunit
VNGNTIPSVVRRAFKIAMEERPGSVHLELPEDIAIEEVADRIFTVHEIRRPSADEKAVKQAVAMIHDAQRPLILIGAGSNRKRTGYALQQFIEKSGIFFFNTQMGKGVIDEKHPLFLGTAVVSSGDTIHRAIEHADLVINIGHDVIEKPPFFMKREKQRVIHVNYFSSEIDDVYFPQLDVVGDIASSIKHINAHLNHALQWDNTLFAEVKKEIQEDINKKGSDMSFPLKPQALVSLLQKIMADDAILTLDNGLYKIHFARNYLCKAPNTLLLDNALAAMGAGLPSAMAAKLLHPEKEVMCIAGDGGFMMNSQELETAVRLGLDLVILILKDKALGMIKDKQKKKGFVNFGLEFNNPDFVQYAESYGARGYAVKTLEELATLVELCIKLPGVHLIDVPIEYS